MTLKEIEDNNRLIAEFMGAKKRYFLKYADGKNWTHFGEKISDTPFKDIPFRDNIHQSGRNMTKYPALQHHAWQMKPNDESPTFDNWLAYHTSWDWLMHVVEKISEVRGQNNMPSRVEIVPNGYVLIIGESNSVNRKRFMGNVSAEGSLIAATWKVVIDFLNWYNTSQKESK